MQHSGQCFPLKCRGSSDWGRALIGSAVLIAFGGVLLPLAHVRVALAIALLITQQLVDFGYAITFINETSLRQAAPPDHVWGRVNVGMHLIARGIVPIGALLGSGVGSA